MQKRAKESLFLMICTQRSCVMIYHYSVMDKKSRIKMIRLFWSKRRDSILVRTAHSVFHGRGRPPEVHSVPFPLRVLRSIKQKKIYHEDISSFTWSKRRDSNPRSPVPETGAIPPSLRLDVYNISIISQLRYFVNYIFVK